MPITISKNSNEYIFAKALVEVLDGIWEWHDLQKMTGLPEQICRELLQTRELARTVSGE